MQLEKEIPFPGNLEHELRYLEAGCYGAFLSLSTSSGFFCIKDLLSHASVLWATEYFLSKWPFFSFALVHQHLFTYYLMSSPSFIPLTPFYTHSGWKTTQGQEDHTATHRQVLFTETAVTYLKNKQLVSTCSIPKLREYKAVHSDYAGSGIWLVSLPFKSMGSTPFKVLRVWFPYLTRWREHRALKTKCKYTHLSCP